MILHRKLFQFPGQLKSCQPILARRRIWGFTSDSIAPLEPLAIDLCGTLIEDLKELRGLDVLEVDLRQIPAKNWIALKQFRSLRRVIVSPDQFSGRALKKLEEYLKVVVRPYEDPTE